MLVHITFILVDARSTHRGAHVALQDGENVGADIAKVAPGTAETAPSHPTGCLGAWRLGVPGPPIPPGNGSGPGRHWGQRSLLRLLTELQGEGLLMQTHSDQKQGHKHS